MGNDNSTNFLGEIFKSFLDFVQLNSPESEKTKNLVLEIIPYDYKTKPDFTLEHYSKFGGKKDYEATIDKIILVLCKENFNNQRELVKILGSYKNTLTSFVIETGNGLFEDFEESEQYKTTPQIAFEYRDKLQKAGMSKINAEKLIAYTTRLCAISTIEAQKDFKDQVFINFKEKTNLSIKENQEISGLYYKNISRQILPHETFTEESLFKSHSISWKELLNKGTFNNSPSKEKIQEHLDALKSFLIEKKPNNENGVDGFNDLIKFHNETEEKIKSTFDEITSLKLGEQTTKKLLSEVARSSGTYELLKLKISLLSLKKDILEK
jgi:hypothetical protein